MSDQLLDSIYNLAAEHGATAVPEAGDALQIDFSLFQTDHHLFDRFCQGLVELGLMSGAIRSDELIPLPTRSNPDLLIQLPETPQDITQGVTLHKGDTSGNYSVNIGWDFGTP